MELPPIRDVFGRQVFAERTVELILKVRAPFSIGIDAKWGNGKTTFVERFLKPEAESKKLPMVIFDCFEHERAGDPFFSITQHILKEFTPEPEESLAGELSKKILSVSSKVAKAGAMVLANSFLRTVFKQDFSEMAAEFTGEKQAEIIAEDATSKLSDFIAAKLQNGQQEELAKKNFYDAVEEMAVTLSEHKKILVVVDELDRCSPKFALDVLESIKHVLNAPGLIFVITYHREQVCHSIKHEFGQQIDSNQYLHKFVNLDLTLPTQRILENQTDYSQLVMQYLNKTPIATDQDSLIRILTKLHPVYNFQARTIERICTLYGVTQQKRFDKQIQILLLIWSIRDPSIVQTVLQGEALSTNQLSNLKIDEVIEILDLEKRSRDPADNIPTLVYIGAIKDGLVASNSDTHGRVTFYIDYFACLSR